MKRYNVSSNRYNGSDGYAGTGMGDGYTGAGTQAAGKRVRIQRVFSKKKLTGPSQTRTRLPAYTRARVQVPGTGTRVRIVPGGF
jgi:hypothetical protein